VPEVDTVGAVESFLRQRLPYWTTVLQRLVRIRSVFEDEEAAVRLVEEEIAVLGLTPVGVAFGESRLRAIPGARTPFSERAGRRNIVVKIPGKGAGRSLALVTHLDVVPEGDHREWTHGPFSADIVDGALYGRGSYDDKAGVIVALALMDLFSRGARIGGDLLFQFVLEDETTGNGTLLCLEDGHVADAAIIIDGTRGDRGINAHAGNVRFGLSVFGRPASVSVSHLGINAAEMLALLLGELRATVLALNAGIGEPWSQFPSPNQFSTVGLSCPEATLTVPETASATCYATFTPPMTLGEFRSLVERTAEVFGASHGLPKPVAFDWTLFAAEPVASEAVALERAMTRTTRIEFGPSTGTSDMRHYVARGIPCVLFGPGIGQNPHRADEHIRLDSLPATLRILASTIVEWCGQVG